MPAPGSQRRVVARLAVALAALSSLACAGDRPIRVGLAGAFSEDIGAPMRYGAELAVEEINAKGGVRGRKIELVVRDDFAEPDSAVRVATELYASDVVAVVGHLYSGTTLAAAPVYNGGSRPLAAIATSSSAPDVSNAGDWVFRVCPSDLAHGAALARWVTDRLDLHRGAVLYLNDAYGRGVRETFEDEFRRREGVIVSSDPYLGDRPQVGPFVERLARDTTAQFLVVAGNRADAEVILREVRARGLTIPVLGGDGLEGIERSPLGDGVYQSSAYLPAVNTATNRAFVAAYRTRWPDKGLPNQPAAAAYDAVHLVARAVDEAGTSRARVRDALARVGSGSAAYEGVTGRIAFDSLGDVPERQVYVGVVRRGEVVLAGGF